MKTKVFILSVLVCGLMSLVACKGPAAKKAVQIGGKVLSSLKNAPKPSGKTVTNVGRTAMVASKHLQLCPTCDGYGVLCYVDNDGYLICDSNGDPVLTGCSNCGGSGVISK